MTPYYYETTPYYYIIIRGGPCTDVVLSSFGLKTKHFGKTSRALGQCPVFGPNKIENQKVKPFLTRERDEILGKPERSKWSF